jgi:hypothetical protein
MLLVVLLGDISNCDTVTFLILTASSAEFNDMLLSAMLEVRAWALARPVAEQDATGDALADRMEKVKRTEEEQGRSPYLGRHIPTFRTVG